MRVWEPRVTTQSATNSSRQRRTWPPPAMKELSNADRPPRRWRTAKTWEASRWSCVALVLVLAFITLTEAAHAQEEDTISSGTLLFQSESGSVEAPRLHTEVHMDVSGIIARVEVRQRFHNASPQWVEGIYAFPLPENSAVNQLHMQVGERIIVGEVREKVEAQQLFQQARANGQRASVVHQQRPNIFRTAVANIGPDETIVITIAYLQVLDQQGGRYSVRFPLTITPRYIPGTTPAASGVITPETPVRALSLSAHDPHDVATLADLQPAFAHANTSRHSVSFEVNLDAGVPLGNLSSAYHGIKVDNHHDTYRVRLADETIVPDRDFELAWTPLVRGGPAAALFRERTESGEHVLLMFMPPQERTPIAADREVIFIIDTSGSMSGISIEQARQALLSGLATLKPADTFNLIQFNSTHEALFEAPVQATQGNIALAHRYVLGLQANGGTEMFSALSAAFAMPRGREHIRQILFITDGAVSNEVELMRLIKESLNDARLFTVGIGSAPNGYFMRTAAQMGRGTFTYIGSVDEVETRMNELFNKLTLPVLTDITLQWPNGVTPEYAPAQVSDLYADEPIVISARAPASSQGVLTITGRTNGVWTRQIALDGAQSHPGVATLWARNRVADLMNLQANRVADTDIRAQVLPLALEYQLVTKYTSLIAVDKTPVRRPDEPLASTRIESTKPLGQNWPAAGIPSTATPAQLHLLVGALALLLAIAVQTLRRRTFQ